jgi:hypothetical protein
VLSVRRAREVAVAAAYEPLGGLVQLGEAGGGEGSVWVGEDGAEDSPALGGFAPTPADRRRFLDLVQQFRDDIPVRAGASGWRVLRVLRRHCALTRGYTCARAGALP